jgi:hypothetical protein
LFGLNGKRNLSCQNITDAMAAQRGRLWFKAQ